MAVTAEEKQTRIVIFSKAPAQHSNTQCLRTKKIPDSRLRIGHVPLGTRRESNAGERVEKRGKETNRGKICGNSMEPAISLPILWKRTTHTHMHMLTNTLFQTITVLSQDARRGRGSSGEGVAGTKKTILPNRETQQRLAAARRHRLRGPNDTARRFNRTKQPLFLRFYAACLFTKHFTWHHGLGCCWRLGLRQMLSREGIVTQDYCSLQQVAPQVVISTCAQTRGYLTYMHVGLVERFCLVSKCR
ncbi:hypothetical protein DPX16_19392 [Anabarilius grahami]|uniref:Uncharacterized protein n=1 Tax=Anabarilius grahami TaxID=495550 RepID=A0A3N0Z0X4_ANAGA|nr:hypothetical protein DPX16_19392 [Anabarilius grahami]